MLTHGMTKTLTFQVQMELFAMKTDAELSEDDREEIAREIVLGAMLATINLVLFPSYWI